MAIVKYRVDSRMLHGQTCTAFGRFLHIDEYIVINEKVSTDHMQRTLLELAAMNSSVSICSPAEAKKLIENNELYGTQTMVVFKDIQDAVELVKLGYHFDELCIGGMFAEAGRNRIKHAICLFVDDEDIKAFRYLEDQGIELTHQVVPDYKASSLKDLVKY